MAKREAQRWESRYIVPGWPHARLPGFWHNLMPYAPDPEYVDAPVYRPNMRQPDEMTLSVVLDELEFVSKNQPRKRGKYYVEMPNGQWAWTPRADLIARHLSHSFNVIVPAHLVQEAQAMIRERATNG